MESQTAAFVPPLAKRIRAARHGTGLSQKKFAQHIGTHLSAELRRPTRFDIMRWEKGDEPRLRMLEAIAKASGKTLDYFLAEGDDEDEESAMRRRLRAHEIVANAASVDEMLLGIAALKGELSAKKLGVPV
jgi:transcriptional regulator with XRE-family HTH domain